MSWQLIDYLFEHKIDIFERVKLHKFVCSLNYWDILTVINQFRVWLIFIINLFT